MDIAKLTYPQAPAIPSVPLLGGKVKIDGTYQEWSLGLPVAGDPFFILTFGGHGSFAIGIESILKDILNIIETQEVRDEKQH